MSVELFHTCDSVFRIYTIVVNFLIEVIFLLSVSYEHFMIYDSYGMFFGTVLVLYSTENKKQVEFLHI